MSCSFVTIFVHFYTKKYSPIHVGLGMFSYDGNIYIII